VDEDIQLAAGLDKIADQIAAQYGEKEASIDGEHHKTWVIDQMVRTLTGDGYEQWVAEHNDGEDGPNSYTWHEGITP